MKKGYFEQGYTYLTKSKRRIFFVLFFCMNLFALYYVYHEQGQKGLEDTCFFVLFWTLLLGVGVEKMFLKMEWKDMLFIRNCAVGINIAIYNMFFLTIGNVIFLEKLLPMLMLVFVVSVAKVVGETLNMFFTKLLVNLINYSLLGFVKGFPSFREFRKKLSIVLLVAVVVGFFYHSIADFFLPYIHIFFEFIREYWIINLFLLIIVVSGDFVYRKIKKSA